MTFLLGEGLTRTSRLRDTGLEDRWPLLGQALGHFSPVAALVSFLLQQRPQLHPITQVSALPTPVSTFSHRYSPSI